LITEVFVKQKFTCVERIMMFTCLFRIHVALYFLFVYGVVSLKTIEVLTNLGRVIGSIEDSVISGTDDNFTVLQYVKYLGIPYAEPPVGELRFQKPVAKKPWNDTHNGTVFGPMCHQGNGRVSSDPMAIVDNKMSEDCLTLDIYAPVASTTSGDSYAVMVFLLGATGGSKGFIADTISAYGDVVVVVVNFRTHVLGYFSTGDSAAPGNFGLWDQMMAIHWVKDHISKFGGDSDRISLAGYSMGGSNAILQILNPKNKGIVKRVIALAGTPFPTYRSSSFLRIQTGSDFVERVGCRRDSSKETVVCLRTKSITEIDNALSALPYSISFTPVVDGDFIPIDPQLMLTSYDTSFLKSIESFGSVELMLGLTNREGGAHISLMWSNLLGQQVNTFQINKTSFENLVVPTAMDIVFGENVSDAVLQNVVFQYSDLLDPSNNTKVRNNVVNLSTDIDVAAPIVKTANFHSKISTKTTFLYQFSANLSLNSSLTPSWLDGANHGDDVYFLFGFSQRYLDAWKHTKGFVPRDYEISTAQQWRTVITNFVKSG
jgi:carboxylesterase type B